MRGDLVTGLVGVAGSVACAECFHVGSTDCFAAIVDVEGAA